MPDIATRTGEERFGLLVDRECTAREHRRLTTRVRQAKRRQPACLEDLDARHPRGVEKSLIARLATGPWVRARPHVFITGPTGLGNTGLGGALGQHAGRDGLTALDLRLPRFLPARPLATGEGRDGQRLTALAKPDVVMLDDWGLAPFSEEHRRD
jgi:DNA replication protein DnaC